MASQIFTDSVEVPCVLPPLSTRSPINDSLRDLEASAYGRVQRRVVSHILDCLCMQIVRRAVNAHHDVTSLLSTVERYFEVHFRAVPGALNMSMK